jgi:hypothetical protein
VYRRRRERFTDQCVYESDRFGGGSVMVWAGICVTDQVIKEEHGCDSGSESLDKHEPRDVLHCYFERCDQSFAVAVRVER